MCVCVYVFCVYIYISGFIYMYTHRHMHTYTHIHICHICVYAYMHICMYTYTHIFLDIQVSRYQYTYIHHKIIFDRKGQQKHLKVWQERAFVCNLSIKKTVVDLHVLTLVLHIIKSKAERIILQNNNYHLIPLLVVKNSVPVYLYLHKQRIYSNKLSIVATTVNYMIPFLETYQIKYISSDFIKSVHLRSDYNAINKIIGMA